MRAGGEIGKEIISLLNYYRCLNFLLDYCPNFVYVFQLQRSHPETSDSSEGAEVNGEEEKKKKKKKKEKKHKKHKSSETGSEVR